MKRILFLAAGLIASTPLIAQTLMVYVEEPATTMPALVRRGVQRALFEGGYIFFDPGERQAPEVDWSTGMSAWLTAAARDGGAGILVVARAQTTITSREGKRPQVAVALRVHILDTSGRTVRSLGEAVVSATNEGREESVDHEGVAREVGALVVAELQRALTGPRVGLDRIRPGVVHFSA